ncbi:PREDICTED: uncharacterized protein LOC106808665 [Priapulus caudatus]|uniref:Uncharacterized protein LOC106808665 n=1 Tax=Priapulus caudatus TaxID=37621 RepID=A0ABM1E447_PRICU|nr:PREDICTED: uncharacterized protein LOC106808665 [Priapulus caudatus]
MKCPFTLNNGDALYKNSWKVMDESGTLLTVYSYYEDAGSPRQALRHLVNRSEVVCSKNECVLTIKQLRAEDEGAYLCNIEFDRKVGESKKFNLSVNIATQDSNSEKNEGNLYVASTLPLLTLAAMTTAWFL